MRFQTKTGLIIVALLVCLTGKAQNYTRDVGLRIGDNLSATYRIHLSDNQAFEGIFYGGKHGSTFTILKEHFQPALGQISENLYFTYGYGAHAGLRYINNYRILNRVYDLGDYRVNPVLGIDGMIGLEYRFPDLPLLMSIDTKPYFEYSTIQIFSLYLQSIGFSIKYRF
jgi:hypothetical protein